MLVHGAVVELETNLGRVRRYALQASRREVALHSVQLRHRLGEVGVDRVELLDRRQMRGFGLADERAFRHERAPDAARDRRANGGVVEI